MADDIKTTLEKVTAQVAGYVEDVATLTVVTKYVSVDAEMAADFDQARPGARTIIRLDGDSEAVVPLQKGETGLEVNRALFELHERSVATAIEYRAKLLQSLLSMLQQARG